ncbi:hypothetical protein GPUN_1321 [Glaciecola punicea ACAM 611]|uniref:Uncharacterized protein n=1 Tax=Glaciecola punicea ACAM 611 TaxID=1121923 RepID=H5TAW8_9ALTE|nr:hypothetical protein GPUN_1321 [Glaciecola punicea ACAM 611]
MIQQINIRINLTTLLVTARVLLSPVGVISDVALNTIIKA